MPFLRPPPNFKYQFFFLPSLAYDIVSVLTLNASTLSDGSPSSANFIVVHSCEYSRQELEMLHKGKCPLMEWTTQASISSSNFENTSFINVDVGT
jgi:hypothetical protein